MIAYQINGNINPMYVSVASKYQDDGFGNYIRCYGYIMKFIEEDLH